MSTLREAAEEALRWMEHARLHLTIKERMHPDGLSLYDSATEALRSAVAEPASVRHARGEVTTTKGNDMTIEHDIQAAGANVAPRITPTDIEASIGSEHYFTAADGEQGALMNEGRNPSGIPSNEALCLLTFCILVLRNGFTVTGESACASPENFDAEIGRKVARANAIAKVWPLLGYELRTQLRARAEKETT